MPLPSVTKVYRHTKIRSSVYQRDTERVSSLEGLATPSTEDTIPGFATWSASSKSTLTEELLRTIEPPDTPLLARPQDFLDALEAALVATRGITHPAQQTLIGPVYDVLKATITTYNLFLSQRAALVRA